MWQPAIKRPLLQVGALSVALLAACTVSSPSSETSSLRDLVSAKDQELGKLKESESLLKASETQLKADLAKATAALPATQIIKSTIIQGGEVVATATTSASTGWENAESIRGGLKLVATYNSTQDASGSAYPDAWDSKASPLVYMTSEGTEDSSPKYDKNAAYFAGFNIVDAASKSTIAQSLINVGQEINRFPHGFCTSPDGKWGYVGWGQKTKDGTSSEGVVAIVNMRTLKIAKLLKQESYYQGKLRSQNLHHVQAFRDSAGKQRVVLMWGFGANGGPHHILDPDDDNKVVKSITYDDVMPMGHPYLTNSPDGKYIYVSMGAPWIASEEGHRASIAKVNLTTGAVIVITGVGSHPIGITHTMDGKVTYVVDGHGSEVFKIDDTTNKVVGETSAGVAGPYGIALNWDETMAYVIGKGESTHNLGGNVSVLDLKTFKSKAPTGVRQMPIFLGGSASSVDHGILHPDPAKNELWVSNMNGWETIVLDLNTHKPKAYIPTANGGNTHSGCFVQYTGDWVGELLADQGGPKGKTMIDLVKAKVAALATQ